MGIAKCGLRLRQSLKNPIYGRVFFRLSVMQFTNAPLAWPDVAAIMPTADTSLRAPPRQFLFHFKRENT